MKTFQDGDPLFGVMVNAIANLWPNGTAVLSGCTPTGSGAARQITVAAGTVVIGGTVRPVSQQTKTLDAAAFDRYDLISVNTSGTVVVTKGTEERRVPALPANSVPIAICLVETGQTTLPADRIYDSRVDALRLSVLNIDADKNWNGKEISNVIVNGTLKATRFTITTGSETVMTIPDSENIGTSSSWVTYKKFKIPGIVGSASFTLSCRFVKSYSVTYLFWRLLVDGVVIEASPHGTQGSSFVRTVDLTDITNNSVIELQCNDGGTSACHVTIDQIKVIGKCEPVLDILPVCTVTDVA